MLSGRLVSAGGKVLVAAATASALGDGDALVGLGKVVQLLAGIVVIHDRPDRNFQHHSVAVTAGTVGAFTVTSAFAFVFRIEPKMHQCIVPLAGFHDDV